MKNILQIFIAIIPLIVSFSTSDPTLAIRFLCLACLVGILLVILLFKRETFSFGIIRHPVSICLLVILFTFSISFILNGFSSEGLYTLLKFFLMSVFTLLATHIMLKYGFKEFIKPFVIFSLLLSFIYIIEYIINYPEILRFEHEWQRNREFDKLASTMGHKNLLASIQFLILPFLIYLITSARKLWRYLSILAILLIILTFIQIQSRAAFASIFIFAITYLLINKRSNRVTLFIGFFLALFIFSGYSIMKYTDRLEAFKLEIKKTMEFSANPRFKLYKSTLKLIKDNPLFGVGPGKWKVNVWQYGLYFNSNGKSFAQRPHNDFLWVFAEGGVFAGLSYLIIFLILLRDSYFLHKKRRKEDGIIYSLLFAVLTGYGFISLIDFPLERIGHSIIFLIIASIIISSKLKEKKSPQFFIPYWVSYILLFIVCFIIYVSSIRYQSEIHAANAIEFKQKGNWNNVVRAIEKSYNKNFYELDNTSTPLLWYRGVAYFNQQKYSLALHDFQAAYELHPYHVHVLNNLATLYQIKGESDKAKRFYRSVFDVNPTFMESRVNLAAILFNEKKYIESLDVILQSNVPKYWKRKKENINYDLYLKTIVKSWSDSIFEDATKDQKKMLKKLLRQFENRPAYAAEKAKNIFEIRDSKNVTYLQALVNYNQNN